jgi:cell division protein YceG involved in septum cleavage
MLSNFTLKIIDSGIINDMGSIEILDVINLASIVEKEERNASEKSTVAGILKKRLDE